jgi:hypothetical protein
MRKKNVKMNFYYVNICSMNDAFPSSLLDSNVSPRWTQRNNEKLGYAPWLIALWGKRGVMKLWDIN